MIVLYDGDLPVRVNIVEVQLGMDIKKRGSSTHEGFIDDQSLPFSSELTVARP